MVCSKYSIIPFCPYIFYKSETAKTALFNNENKQTKDKKTIEEIWLRKFENLSNAKFLQKKIVFYFFLVLRVFPIFFICIYFTAGQGKLFSGGGGG